MSMFINLARRADMPELNRSLAVVKSALGVCV